jgi:hypothetical protein
MEISETDLRSILGNVIQNDDYSASRITPYFSGAIENWLVPEIGSELYETIVSYQKDDVIIEVMDSLILRVKRAVVWAAYNDYLPFSLGKDTGNGIVEEVSDNSKAVRIGILEKRITATKLQLGQAIDQLMSFLFTNRANYPQWAESVTGLSSLSLFVRSGVELGKSLPESGGSYWLFKKMRQYFFLKTNEVLEPVLGADLLVKLKGDLLNDALIEPYKELRKVCANYLSFWVYSYIFPSMVVGFTDNGILRVLSEFDGINNQKTPTEEQLTRLLNGIERQKIDALKALELFLKKNANDLPEFDAPVPDANNLMQKPPFMRNRDKKRIFGL